MLVSSGGLGREVSPLLRSAALPGASALLSLAAHPRVLSGLSEAGRALRRRGSGTGVQLQAIARALRPLEEPGARAAFLHTLRSVIDVHGQRVSASDRLYLVGALPTLIVWGERDHTIPLAHGRSALARSRAAASRPSRVPRTSPTSRIRRGSPRSCTTSSRAPSRRGSRTLTGARSSGG